MPWVARQEGPRRLSQSLLLPIAAGPQVAPLSFDRLGSAGLLLLVSCDIPAWLSLYVSDAAALADANRPQSADPDPAAGVVLDAVFTEDSAVLRLPPGVSWANQDDPPAALLHGRLRTDQGQPIEAMLSISSLLLAL
ncbi:MAG: hypothetical protein KME02_14340 [Aphanothece saxicola GSE-SYN-MK-01-06B]|jgi:hypothetical protein|nr:hypothetical protein [Aphanothece saxicola GSE-SYN-MK-01-06B]